ncbi:hypothetical protein ACH4UM_41190 [Streptomyces sp. NPDC020801]|uniref:hypothetical protein n=1 Tax=Streptomyces sp. NPDC020801 TaxID=3365093 RepID=UPI003793A158
MDLSDDRAFDAGDECQGRVGASLLDLWSAKGPDGGNWNKTIDVMARTTPGGFRKYSWRAGPKPA